MTDRNAADDMRASDKTPRNELQEEVQKFREDIRSGYRRINVLHAVCWTITMALTIAILIRG